MKIMLLTFLIGCLCSFDSFAQPNNVVDTAQIKPIEILENEDNYVCGWNKEIIPQNISGIFFKFENSG